MSNDGDADGAEISQISLNRLSGVFGLSRRAVEECLDVRAGGFRSERSCAMIALVQMTEVHLQCFPQRAAVS